MLLHTLLMLPHRVCAQINGKKLHPARGAFAVFMLPLLAWWIVALVIYGISFQKVALLQAPLTSLQVSATESGAQDSAHCTDSIAPGDLKNAARDSAPLS